MRKGCGKLEPTSYYDGCKRNENFRKIIYICILGRPFTISWSSVSPESNFPYKRINPPQMNCIAKRNHNKPEYIYIYKRACKTMRKYFIIASLDRTPLMIYPTNEYES